MTSGTKIINRRTNQECSDRLSHHPAVGCVDLTNLQLLLINRMQPAVIFSPHEICSGFGWTGRGWIVEGAVQSYLKTLL